MALARTGTGLLSARVRPDENPLGRIVGADSNGSEDAPVDPICSEADNGGGSGQSIAERLSSPSRLERPDSTTSFCVSSSTDVDENRRTPSSHHHSRSKHTAASREEGPAAAVTKSSSLTLYAEGDISVDANSKSGRTTNIASAGALVYHIPPQVSSRVTCLELFFFLCVDLRRATLAAADVRAAPPLSERVSLYDTQGRRLVCLHFQQNMLFIWGDPRETTTSSRRRNSAVAFQHLMSPHSQRGEGTFSSMSNFTLSAPTFERNLLSPSCLGGLAGDSVLGLPYSADALSVQGEQWRAEGHDRNPRGALAQGSPMAKLELEPREWYRAALYFDWSSGEVKVVVDALGGQEEQQQHRHRGDGDDATRVHRGAQQEVRTVQMGGEVGGTRDGGLGSVDVYPRKTLLLSYCNTLVRYTG